MPGRRFMKSVCLLFLSVFLLSCSENSPAPAPIFSSPARLAAVDSATLLVSDYTENRFCTVDKTSLDIVQCFSAKGQPTGVAYADYNGGRFFVGNKSVRSVDIFDAQGTFLGHVGGGTGLFQQVNDLTIDAVNERLYILDSKAAVVNVYDFNGAHLGLDFGAGVLVQPTAIAIDPVSGYFYVSDFGSADDIEDSSIAIFNGSGVLVGSIPGKGSGMLSSLIFSAPQGLYVDTSGYIYMVDSGFGKVFIFDPALTLVKTVGERGTDLEQLFYPLDLFVDDVSKDIFVTDNRNGRVTVFWGGGVVP